MKNLFFVQTTIFILILFSISTPYVSAFQVADTDMWHDDFIGAAESQPTLWHDLSNGGSTIIEIAHSANHSYAYITLTTSPSTDKQTGYVFSDNLACNFDLCDTLDVRIDEVYTQTNCAWSLSAIAMDGNIEVDTQIMHIASGANGLFSFPFKQMSGWTGSKSIRLQMEMKSNVDPTYDFVLIDFFRIYKNTSNIIYFWQEDFQNGIDGMAVKNWWDNRDEQGLNAEINYHFNGNTTVARVTLLPTTDHWGKVITPGVYLDIQKYYHLKIALSDLPSATGCEVKLIRLGSDQEILIGYITQSGFAEFDLRSVAGYPWWTGKPLVAVELIISGNDPDRYYDVNYIGVMQDTSKNIIPTPTPETFPKGGYAIPNPFVPEHGPVQFFTQFSQPYQQNQVKIMNLKGRVVRTMHDRFWDGNDDQGNPCEGGIYIYQITADQQHISGKVVLIR